MNELDLSWDTGITLLDNVAKLGLEGVYVFDRRRYPFEQQWLLCRDLSAVAGAIKDMVTQSRGPGVVAAYGMMLAAREVIAESDPTAALRARGQVLKLTRPTNDSVGIAVDAMLAACDGLSPAQWTAAMADQLRALEESRRIRGERLGKVGAPLLGQDARILTHCWAETGIPQIVLEAVRTGKNVHAYVTETRPYLQGARLTADALRDAGARVTVIPDGAVGFVISERRVDLAITGSDRVTADGGVVNKIGTLNIAALCARFEVPYYAVCNHHDLHTPTPSQVVVEERDGREVLECLGERTATDGVEGFYPAFDRTPAELVAGLITERGMRLMGHVNSTP